MFSKKQLAFTSLILALLFHFVFYLNYYGPSISILKKDLKYLLAVGSAFIMVFLYFATYWRADLKKSGIIIVFDILMLWIFISLARSLLEIKNFKEAREFILNNYMALSLFPILFFILGVSPKYFSDINKTLFIYTIIAFLFSLLFIQQFELQLFLTYSLFFIILTIPLRSSKEKLLIVAISIVVIIFSLTNRAGIIRILFSYCVVAAYYFLERVKIGKKMLYTIVFLVLMIPVTSLYLATRGHNVFQIILGEDEDAYSQLDPLADTRTFLYYEVFQDLKINKAWLFGKGLNAGYDSPSFRTYRREVVEVGFLQILMKTGVIGFLLYAFIIGNAVYKAILRSNNLFIKTMGLFLTSYFIMLFIENQIAYNLLNVIVWIVVGFCHSPEIRGLDNKEVLMLFQGNNN
jgi:hypothetical protein